MKKPRRQYVTCRRCGKPQRTRRASFITSKVCDECIRSALKRNVLAKSGSVNDLAWTCMRERWFHELLFRQVEHNGLDSLGIGRLSFVDDSQRSERDLGRIRSRNGSEYDLLLKAEDGRAVCVEVKRVADESAVAQLLRYRSSLKSDGYTNPIVVLVAVEVQEKTMDTLVELAAAGVDILVYRIASTKDGFSLERLEAQGE